MLKFNKVLLASDFDNTLVYTQSALDNGTDIPPMCPRNREALDYFIQKRRPVRHLHRPRAARVHGLRQGRADERAVRHRQRRGDLRLPRQ